MKTFNLDIRWTINFFYHILLPFSSFSQIAFHNLFLFSATYAYLVSKIKFIALSKIYGPNIDDL